MFRHLRVADTGVLDIGVSILWARGKNFQGIRSVVAALSQFEFGSRLVERAGVAVGLRDIDGIAGKWASATYHSFDLAVGFWDIQCSQWACGTFAI